MAYGLAEDPALSITPHLDAVDYPVWRDQLVRSAEDGGASVDIINLFRCLPRGKYETRLEVMRDLAEAARRFAMGNRNDDDGDGAVRDRRNIGRDAVENAPPGHSRHP